MFDNSLNQKDVDEDDKEETTRSKQGKQKPTTMADVLLTKHAFWVHRRRWDLLKRWCVVYCDDERRMRLLRVISEFCKVFFMVLDFPTGRNAKLFGSVCGNRFRFSRTSFQRFKNQWSALLPFVLGFVCIRFSSYRKIRTRFIGFLLGFLRVQLTMGHAALECRRGNMK